MLDTTFWKKYFSVYDTLNELIPYKRLIEDIVASSGDLNQKKVLDLGSGTGNASQVLKKFGAIIYAIDYSEIGTSIHKQKDKSATITVGDITKKLPYKDNEFDVVISNNVLYTIPPQQRQNIIDEVYRILRPGGKVVVSNLAQGFKPTHIYINHLKTSAVELGIVKSIFNVLKFIKPTILIFYYNHLIKKEHKSGTYSFMGDEEQRLALTNAGFKNVTENKRTYANQAILNTGTK